MRAALVLLLISKYLHIYLLSRYLHIYLISVHRCYCSRDGTSIPGGLALEDTPQMVLIMLGEAATSSLQSPASAVP